MSGPFFVENAPTETAIGNKANIIICKFKIKKLDFCPYFKPKPYNLRLQ